MIRATSTTNFPTLKPSNKAIADDELKSSMTEVPPGFNIDDVRLYIELKFQPR